MFSLEIQRRRLKLRKRATFKNGWERKRFSSYSTLYLCEEKALRRNVVTISMNWYLTQYISHHISLHVTAKVNVNVFLPTAHQGVHKNSFKKSPCIPGSNWNLERLVFKGRRKPEYPEKNLSGQSREPTTNSTHIWRRVRESNPRHDTLVGGERSHHCAIPTLHFTQLVSESHYP